MTSFEYMNSRYATSLGVNGHGVSGISMASLSSSSGTGPSQSIPYLSYSEISTSCDYDDGDDEKSSTSVTQGRKSK